MDLQYSNFSSFLQRTMTMTYKYVLLINNNELDLPIVSNLWINVFLSFINKKSSLAISISSHKTHSIKSEFSQVGVTQIFWQTTDLLNILEVSDLCITPILRLQFTRNTNVLSRILGQGVLTRMSMIVSNFLSSCFLRIKVVGVFRFLEISYLSLLWVLFYVDMLILEY